MGMGRCCFAGKGVIVSILVFMGCSQSVRADAMFRDGFESGNLKNTQNGFRWEGNNGTISVVRTDGFVVSDTETVEGPFPGRRWENAPGLNGRHAMRITYKPTSEWSEQRFVIGSAHRDLWAAWWLRVPINFKHTSATVHNNNKLFMFWMDDYSNKGDGSTVGMEMRSDGSGGSYFYAKVGSGRYTVLGSDQGGTPFISYPKDQGRWMRIVVHLRAESVEHARDGVMQVWRRWADETEYTHTHDLRGQPIRVPAAGPYGFARGYLMGWHNALYEVETEFLIDEFTVSTDSLLDPTRAPRPPNNFIVD